jgi:hypothetical protein
MHKKIGKNCNFFLITFPPLKSWHKYIKKIMDFFKWIIFTLFGSH